MLHQAWNIIRYANLWLNSASLRINRMLESGWQLPRNNVFMWVSLVLAKQERTKKEK